MSGRPKRLPTLSVILGALGLLPLVFALTICDPLGQKATSAAGEGGPSSQAAPGRVIVKFRHTARIDAASSAHQKFGFREDGRINGLEAVKVRLKDDVSPEDAARMYRALPEVEYAEPDYMFYADFAPTDPLYSRQQWYYDLIQAPQAWDKELGEPSVIVAVLDTGVDVTHADLREAIWTNPNETEGNRVDDDDNGCIDDKRGCNFTATTSPQCDHKPVPNNNVSDDLGHGTMVAGVIGARANQVGVMGVAPGVKVMPVKVLDCTGAGSSSVVAAGIMYAAESGARVINISSGSDFDSSVVREAIDEAQDTYGVVFVSSAGNAGNNRVSFPARYEKVIGVSASEHRNPDAKATFSSWGPEVDVSAPGVDIVSTLPQKFCNDPWPCTGGAYSMASGTSFSSPLVAGAAALILSYNPALRPDEVARQLVSSAVDLPDGAFKNWDGAGRIQVSDSLTPTSYRVGVAGITKN